MAKKDYFRHAFGNIGHDPVRWRVEVECVRTSGVPIRLWMRRGYCPYMDGKRRVPGYSRWPCVALRNPKVMNGDSEQPKWCRDGCLVNVLCQRYLVERSHLVDFREDILATGRLYEVSYVSYRITVWSWAAQVLDDRHIMPTYIIVSNCFRAVMKRSGARQRGKLTTVSPGVVLMQYFVACLINHWNIGEFIVQLSRRICLNFGNSLNSSALGSLFRQHSVTFLAFVLNGVPQVRSYHQRQLSASPWHWGRTQRPSPLTFFWKCDFVFLRDIFWWMFSLYLIY